MCLDTNEVIKKINKNTKGVLLSHIQGFNGLSEKLLNVLNKNNIPLIEDVYESHGARFKKENLAVLERFQIFILLCTSHLHY